MNCPPPSKCTEREFNTTKYIVSNCNVIEVTLTQKQNIDCTTEFVSLLDDDGNSYPENSEFVSVNNQISRVVIEGISTCASDAMSGSTIPTVQDCDGNNSVPVYDQCSITAINTAKDAIVAAINGRPDYTAQLTSIGDTLTAMKSDTAAINTGVASSLVLLQAVVDKPDPTPVDLQPVLDKLDSLIALETTENSTLVDIKNQLVAANVTLSNAVGLLTHIDTDMHDVVAKLRSVIDLLTSLQTLLTTIDGHIVAVKSAITTADANNVSALNDVKTALQAINVNTDTLEALITAGNVLLTAIVNNTDGVEGLLTEIRDLPVTDSWLLLYDNNHGSKGGCKPFIRRIVDNVVTDTELDLTTPYTVVGEVRAHCPDAIVLELVDYVAEFKKGGGIVQKTPAWAAGNGWQFVPVSGTPITSWDLGYWGYTKGTDANTSFKVVTQISVESGKLYNIKIAINRTKQAFRYIIDGVEYPIDNKNETKTWVATTTGSVEFGVVVGTNATSASFNNFSVDTLDGETTVPATCTNFVRKIVDGVVTDYAQDGVATYVVQGEVRAHCPDAQKEPTCTCTDELQALQASVDSIHSAVDAGTAAVVAAINGRPDYTAQLTSIGDTLTAMKSDTAAINTGVASSLVLLQAVVDKPDPTPVDLQPVLDKLDSLIALETTENSTLVDIKNQLVAANVTLSNAVGLLTHIDTDMHDVVAKLRSVIDLLTSLQTLLTTIDGHIVAVQRAITTADANNVSALNDVKTALQAININTDTLEALITAGNVSLRAIVNNTDEVEGLLRALQRSVDSIATLFSEKYAYPTYSYHTSAYMVNPMYKSLTVTFINEGTIDNTYAPAGYSFSLPREIGLTYRGSFYLRGTGFAVWEDR